MDKEGLKRVRSPAYPALNLKSAIEKAYGFYRAEGRNAAALAVGLRHWGYSEKSGSGLKALAALKSFGLLEVSGSGSSQRIKLSDLALQIVLDEREDSPERAKALAAAALQPKIHRKLWELWGTDLPSHGNIRHHLIFEEKFNENFVDDFIKEYRSSIAYANLHEWAAPGPLHVSGDESVAQGSLPLPIQSARRARLSPPPGREIARFPVGKNSTISLVIDGKFSRRSIEALVAQLKLNLDLGVFDDLDLPDEG